MGPAILFTVSMPPPEIELPKGWPDVKFHVEVPPIETLPEKQAIVFQLKYFEELKYSEISKRLNTSEGALKANFHHAKQKIQDFILNKLNH